MGQNDRWNVKTKGALAAAILLLAGVALATHGGLFDGLFGKSPAELAKAAGVTAAADAVRIPVAVLDSGKALFLETELGGRQVRYFAMRSADGAYRAAFDACDVCFKANRGYRQEGDLMVCNQCGQAFPGDRINEVKGGCNPAPLARQVEGQHLVIRKADMEAGTQYFPLKRS
jgi:uncharacterized membrane protein